MSRKTKSELSFLVKISILFIILFASKIHKSSVELVNPLAGDTIAANVDLPAWIQTLN